MLDPKCLIKLVETVLPQPRVRHNRWFRVKLAENRPARFLQRWSQELAIPPQPDVSNSKPGQRGW